MSERSSFVTEYIYCAKCFDVMRRALLGDDRKFLTTRVIGDFPIIAGKVGCSAPGMEWETLMEAFGLAEVDGKLGLCHTVMIAVIGDNGATTTYAVDQYGFEITPVGTVWGYE